MAADKNKYTIWMYPETWEKVKELYKEAGCPRKSDFIEQAIRFYVGYLTAENKANFLPNMFLSNMKSIVRESDNRNTTTLSLLATIPTEYHATLTSAAPAARVHTRETHRTE